MYLFAASDFMVNDSRFSVELPQRLRAPRGNKNAEKLGLYAREAIAQRRQLAELIRQSRQLILKIE
jgi:hypothetical protein